MDTSKIVENAVRHAMQRARPSSEVVRVNKMGRVEPSKTRITKADLREAVSTSVKTAIAEALATKATTNKLGNASAIPTPQPPFYADDDVKALAGTLKGGTPDGPISSAIGQAIRNDRTNAIIKLDTNKRTTFDPDILETAQNLRGQKATRQPTRAEIEACSQKNASNENSVLGAMRASRLIREGKL